MGMGLDWIVNYIEFLIRAGQPLVETLNTFKIQLSYMKKT